MIFEIPEERLPPGFVDTVGEPPPQPARPNPAATIVLMRDRDASLQVLLMRRNRTSGFVPGAWVFPGGRVDAADSGPALYERVKGLGGDPYPGSSYWAAALRELFEETGVLLAREADGRWVADAVSERRMEALRCDLMDDRITLLDVLEELDAVLDTAGMVHMAHWVTPVVESRRYDTHFFAVALPPDRDARPDAREMAEAAWLAPGDALVRFETGDLPMVFPTVKTLESLSGYDSVEHALAAIRGVAVPRILPRLVRTESGVAIVVDEDVPDSGPE